MKPTPPLPVPVIAAPGCADRDDELMLCIVGMGGPLEENVIVLNRCRIQTITVTLSSPPATLR